MLRQGTLVRPLPPDVPHLSSQKVNAELWYNRIPFSKILFMANLTLGFAAFGLFMFRMLTSRKEKAVSRRVWGTASASPLYSMPQDTPCAVTSEAVSP